MEGPTVLKTVTKLVGRSPKAIKQGKLEHIRHNLAAHGICAVATVHHALTIPEIVESIFSYSERGPLTRAARVCREWHVISLPEIWRVLTSLVSLLELFCPMTFDVENGWVSTRCSFLHLGVSQFRVLGRASIRIHPKLIGINSTPGLPWSKRSSMTRKPKKATGRP